MRKQLWVVLLTIMALGLILAACGGTSTGNGTSSTVTPTAVPAYVGSWESGLDTLILNADGSGIFNGVDAYYTVEGDVLTYKPNEAMYGSEVDASTVTIKVEEDELTWIASDGKEVIYTRLQ